MIRTIIIILRKYLKEAYREEEQWEAIVHDPFDLMAAFPDYDMLRRLAHDLVKVTKTEKCEKHIRIPDQQSTIKFLKEHHLGEIDEVEEDFFPYEARALRKWLWEYNLAGPDFQHRFRFAKIVPLL